MRKIKGEWLKAVDSKSTVPLWYRGFESLPLRHPRPAHMERCESGRIGAPGERVGAKSVPWVRIPPSPLRTMYSAELVGVLRTASCPASLAG